MPEFILEMGSGAAGSQFRGLPAFTRGYIEAAFFCGVETREGERDELDRFAFSDLAPSALLQIVEDCNWFRTKCAIYIRSLCGSPDFPSYDEEAAGRDYWFTRNGHGVGYWDRGFTGSRETIADLISGQARADGEIYLYEGDDGRVWYGAG